MKVKNIMGYNGNRVKNQFIITDDDKITFQSYDSEIVTIDEKNACVSVGGDWNYSATTNRYRNKFMADMGFTKAATKAGFMEALKAGFITGEKGKTYSIIMI